jgi:hypothetical protein
MTEANCMDSVIKRVDAATYSERPGQKRVVVDLNRKTAVGTAWFRSESSLKYFLVSTDVAARCQTSEVYARADGQGQSVGIKVTYTASCPEGNEELVAESLCDDPSPNAVLAGMIRGWAQDHLSQQPSALFDNYLAAKAQLEQRLSERALKETGLALVAEASLCGWEEVATRLYLGPVKVSVTLSNYGEPRQVSILAELITGPEDMIKAIAHRADDARLGEITKQAALLYFADYVGLQEFYGSPDVVEMGLKSHLDAALKTVGRRVQEVHVEYDRDVPTAPFETQEEIEYRVLGYPEPIIIKDSVQLAVQDYAAYLSGNSPDFGPWLTENLTRVAQQALYGKTYEDILLGLETAAQEIKTRLSFKAGAIGCVIQQQLTITTRSIEVWLRGITLVTDETFETGLEGFRVRLRITAATILRQIQDLRHYVARGLDVPSLMEQRLLEEVKQTLLTIHPARLYARQPSHEPGGEEPVKALLCRKIRETLAQEFNAEVLSVSVEPADTELVKWVNDLRREAISFEVEVISHNPHSKGPFTFFGDCQVEDISSKGWERAWSAGLDIARLKEQFVNALKSGLETRTDVELAYTAGDGAEKLKGEIARLVIDYVLREFGLMVKVRNVRRKATEIEKEMRATELSNERLRIKTLGKLEGDMILLIASGAKNEEIAKVQKAITALKSYGAISLSPSDNQESRPQTTEPDGRAGTPTSVNSHDNHGSEHYAAEHMVGN